MSHILSLMEKLRTLFTRRNKTPDICAEPPEAGITTWMEADSENPGLFTVCRTPEEKQRVYKEANEFAKNFWANAKLKLVSEPMKSDQKPDPEYII